MTAALALVACRPDVPTARTGASAGAADGVSLRAPLIAALGARLTAGGDADAPAAPAWPADLSFHPDARAESIELVALLDDLAATPGDDRRPAYAVVRRFDRLGVRAPSDGEAPSGEDFRFRDVVRASALVTAGALGSAPASTVHRDVIERVTLGLADASVERLQVRDAAVARVPRADTAPGRDTGRTGTASGCAGSGHVVSDDDMELVFSQEACPAATSIGPLVVASSPTLDVRGTLEVGGERRAVSGHGWVRRAWGAPPSATGAVVFDRLLVELDGVGLIDLSRSKRRSGRGPRITTAALRPPGRGAAVDAGTGAAALEDADWRDDALDGDLPSGWRLVVPSAGIDVVLEPFADVPVVDGAIGRAWRGAVVARGSHAGDGFVEFVPIDTAQAHAAAPRP